mmetsp:Transcript_15176/g.37679  ORF Transcript_15176/g.37679 Transcript_15176/m.37679 type:complete len:281 (-) Transcript_15176:333-1175(-)
MLTCASGTQDRRWVRSDASRGRRPRAGWRAASRTRHRAQPAQLRAECADHLKQVAVLDLRLEKLRQPLVRRHARRRRRQVGMARQPAHPLGAHRRPRQRRPRSPSVRPDHARVHRERAWGVRRQRVHLCHRVVSLGLRLLRLQLCARQPRLVRGSAPLHLARLLALETEARAARAREHTITSDAREPARRTRPVELAARRLLLLLLLLILIRHGRHHGGRIRLGTAAQWQCLLLRSGLHLLGHLRDSRLGHPARRRHQAHRRHGRGGAGARGGADVVQHN